MSLWNSTPNNPGPRNAGIEPLTANSVKCPSCASNIFYEPEINGMMCRNCGNVYDPTTMEPRGSLGINKEHDYTGDGDMSEDDKKRHEIICNSCGTALVADENTMSTMCPFCGSPALITKRMSREFKPDYIIPFKIDKDRATSIFNEWLATRQFTPRGFKNKCRLAKMTALYVPFWLLDCHVNTEMSGTGKNRQGLTKLVYEVNSTLTYYVKGVPFDGALKIANKLMEAIEPFDYSEMVKFESKYLQGFYADKYDLKPTDIAEKMFRRLDSFSYGENDVIARKYDEYEARPEKTFSWMSDVKTKYCLLPVWFMTVEFDGKQYQFAVNGQTGEASGQMPTTSTADKLEFFNRIVSSKWKWVPILSALVIPVILGELLFRDLRITPFKTFMIRFLSVLEILTLVFIALMFVASFLSKFVTKRIRKVADEVNDYDKDPGLDHYLDMTQKSKIKVEENFLGQVMKETDNENNIIGDSIFDPFVP